MFFLSGVSLLHCQTNDDKGTAPCSHVITVPEFTRAHLVGRGLAQMRNLFCSGDSRSIPTVVGVHHGPLLLYTSVKQTQDISWSSRQTLCWTSWFWCSLPSSDLCFCRISSTCYDVAQDGAAQGKWARSPVLFLYNGKVLLTLMYWCLLHIGQLAIL